MSKANGQGGCVHKLEARRILTDDAPLRAAKAVLRQTLRDRRRALDPAFRAAAAEQLADALPTMPPAAVVAAYWPRGSELDIRPALRRLAGAGHALALPVVVERDTPLVFRQFRFGDPLVRGNGADVPVDQAPELEPDVLLVPLLGFDRTGARLGQGAGYYDRTLARLRARRAVRAIGVGFAVQEVPDVPAGPLDQRLDLIVTEAGPIVMAV